MIPEFIICHTAEAPGWGCLFAVVVTLFIKGVIRLYKYFKDRR